MSCTLLGSLGIKIKNRNNYTLSIDPLIANTSTATVAIVGILNKNPFKSEVY
jgi:hypothetical protein